MSHLNMMTHICKYDPGNTCDKIKSLFNCDTRHPLTGTATGLGLLAKK